jgi:hypothetical protein
MFIPFTPHRVNLKPDAIKELIKQKVLKEDTEYTSFSVIAMDIKTEKQDVFDKEKYDEDDEEDEIKTKEIEVAEIMLLIGIPYYGYFWIDQEETTFHTI